MKLNFRFFVSSALTFVFLTAFGAVLPSVSFSTVSARTEKEISPAARENAYRANNIGIAYLEQFDYPNAAASFRESH